MKKLLLMTGILLCMLLTSCKNNTDVQQNETNEAAAENEEEKVSEAVIYDDHGITLTLMASSSINNYNDCYFLICQNNNDAQYTLKTNQWVVNDNINVSGSSYISLDPMASTADPCRELTKTLYMLDVYEVSSIKFSLVIMDENYENIEDIEINTAFDKPIVPSVFYETFMDAKAGEQILIDDDNVRATLLGWGKEPGGNYVRGMIFFENKSSEQIPVKISGVSINGIFIENFDHVNFLEPGQSCYSLCSMFVSDVEDEGIESITDIRMLLLTDESQNTGMVNYSGGIWYPVLLEEKGTAADTFAAGEVLEAADMIEISMLSQEVVAYEFQDGGIYKNKIAIINNSDENIEVVLEDVFIDGIPEDTWLKENPDNSFFMENDEVGAHSKRYASINVASYKGEILIPEITFKIHIRSMAGGAVIHTGEKVITLSPDANIIQ